MEDLKKLRIVFMGTPAFAVASLEALCKAGFQVVGVITAPDKPAGRGLQQQSSAVKKFAIEKGLPLLQPVKLKDPDFLQSLDNWKADLQIVVAFRMLPEVVWSRPRLGTINLHGSLLPQYRGAAPINWAIIDGNTQTGLTTFLLQHEIDTGQILKSTPIDIGPDETAGELHDRMKEIGADLLVKTIVSWVDKTITPTAQAELTPTLTPLRHAPKLTRELSLIDWNQSVQTIHNLVRALSPSPGAYTYLQEKVLKILRAKPGETAMRLTPGQWASDGKTFLRFGCANGILEILLLQLEGKKVMSTEEFLRGYRILEKKS